MESTVVALTGGVVTLARVIAPNLRSRTVMEPKIDELTQHIGKYNCLIEHIYKLEQDVAVVRRDADTLEEKSDR